MKDKIVLVGKGPSAKEIKKSDEYDIACINGAVVLCEEVDILVSNDMETLDLISEEEWQKVKKVVIPTYPHKDWNAQDKYTWKTFLERVPKKVDYFVHRIRTDRGGFDEFPSLGRTFSSGTTALQFIARQGYKEVLHCGIDAQGGYHPRFMKKNEYGDPLNHQCRPEPLMTYQQNWQVFNDIANQNNIKLTQI